MNFYQLKKHSSTKNNILFQELPATCICRDEIEKKIFSGKTGTYWVKSYKQVDLLLNGERWGVSGRARCIRHNLTAGVCMKERVATTYLISFFVRRIHELVANLNKWIGKLLKKFKNTNTEGLEDHCALPLGDWTMFVLHRAPLERLLSLFLLVESANKRIQCLRGIDSQI